MKSITDSYVLSSQLVQFIWSYQDGLFIMFWFLFQLYKLGPAQSLCMSEASDASKEVWDVSLPVYHIWCCLVHMQMEVGLVLLFQGSKPMPALNFQFFINVNNLWSIFRDDEWRHSACSIFASKWITIYDISLYICWYSLNYDNFFSPFLHHIWMRYFSVGFCPLNQKSYSRGITIEFRNEEESRGFHCAFEQWKKEVVIQGWYTK